MENSKNDLRNICGLFVNKSKRTGAKYFSGVAMHTIHEGERILIFKNKKSGRYDLCSAPGKQVETTRGGDIDEQRDDTRGDVPESEIPF